MINAGAFSASHCIAKCHFAPGAQVPSLLSDPEMADKQYNIKCCISKSKNPTCGQEPKFQDEYFSFFCYIL